MHCRLLPHETCDGPANMALDHALLEAVDADPSAAVLRTYGWSAPTLSLGYFQPFAAAEADSRWRGVPIVRRPSGGGALWHDREVTYALVLPRSHPAAGRASDLYRAVHAALAEALASVGVAARRRGDEPAAPDRPFLCFLDRDPEDVLGPGGAKVVGSAQRRRPRAVLQHGALLLARSESAPELPGLAELAGVEPGPEPWIDLVRDAIAARLGLDPAVDAPNSAERAAAAELERTQYRSDDWTRRR